MFFMIRVLFVPNTGALYHAPKIENMKKLKFRQSIHSEQYTKLRNFWRTRRESLGLSQRSLADKLGVPHSLICKIETGDRRLDTLETITYCEALEIEPCDVLNLVK